MAWVAAYNSHNPEAAVALYDEQVTNVQLPWGKPIQGREAMRATYGKVFQAFPDIVLEVENLFEGGSWVAIEWRFSGTMRGEFAGHGPTGRSFAMRGCEVLQVISGKIHAQHGYWDKSTMFEQLGITAGNSG
jgi:steroid delta-isomerase-like uncharacterized protein